MRRQIVEAFRNLKRLPRAYSGTRTGHTPRDGQPPHHRLAALALCLLLVGSLLGPMAFAGSASAVPSGMVGVPDSNVSEDYPVGEAQNASLRASEIEGSVMASDHAESLEVIVTTPERARGYLDTNDTATLSGDRGIALVLRDETHSQGRQVALDAGAVRDALGHTPEQVYGTHEDGSEWTANVEYEAGMLVFDVPHFSSNSVTFSGSVEVAGTYTDGSSVSYSISSTDSVSNMSINVTGHTASEWDNETASGLSSSASTGLNIAGNIDPAGPSESDKPTLRISEQPQPGYNPYTDEGSGNFDGTVPIMGDNSSAPVGAEILLTPSESGVVKKITIYADSVSAESSYNESINLWMEQEGLDTSIAEGTQIKKGWDPDGSKGQISVSLDQEYHVEAGQTYTLGIQATNEDGDTYNDQYNVRYSSTSSNRVWVQKTGSYAQSHVDVEIGPEQTVSNLTASDDIAISKSLGDFEDGETKTVEFPVSTSSTEISLSGSGAGSLSTTLRVKEQTQTVDPSVSVNGYTTSYSGALSDGETISLSANDSWVQDGTNTINMSVGDGTLSGEAPSPSTHLDYSHSASDKQVVDYQAEKWSESYNVSKTFASDRSSASLTIPFDGEVAKIKSIETRTNGGTWSTVSSDNYAFDGTTLTVQLGSVSSGDEVDVRTTGRKVNVVNGKISVLEPTLMGERLDTKFEIDSWSSDAYISLGNTPDGTRINYLYKESWSGADEYATVSADGYHKLYAPGANTGASARVSTIPVRVNPTSGQVRVSVDEPLRSEPKFEAAPGSSPGDTVEYTFVDATDGTSYALYSITRDTAVDQGTAQSPLTLTDDDSEETLQFQIDDSGNLTSDGSGGGGFFGSSSASGAVIPAMPVLNPGLVVVIVLCIIVGAVAYQQRRVRKPDVPDRAIYRSPLVLLAVGVALFLGILLISPETVTTWITLGIVKPLSQALSAALPLAGVLGVMAGIGMVVYWWWTRRQAKKADAATPDTVFRIRANKGDEK